MGSDLRAATGIVHGCLAGLITIALVALLVWIIASIVQAEEHIPYEPAEQDWLTPYPPGKNDE